MFWFNLSMLPPSMGNLTSLLNLPVFQVGHENGHGIEQLEKMAGLSGTLHISKLEKAVNAGAAKLNEKKSLSKLVFEWSDGVFNTHDEATDNNLLEDLEPHSNLKELQILRYRGNEFPAWIKDERLQNLVSLTLNGCKKCKTLALAQLPNLRELFIKGMLELQTWPEVECPSLGRLKLSNCPDLRELPIIFPNLRVLTIKSCNSLRVLPVVPSLQFLILIDNLILEDWNEVPLPMLQVGNDQGQLLIRLYPSLIELLELKVIGCPKLQALPENFGPQKLEISRCELMTTLPPPPQAQRLQQLALEGCDDGALVRAIPDSKTLFALVISSISNISSLPRWPQLPALEALYIRDCRDLVSLSNGEEGSLRTLTFLKLLSIRNCEKLETLNEELPTTLECLMIASCPLLNSFSLNNPPSLTDLYIEDCPLLQSLPEDGLPSSLRHLLIQTCPLLSQRCRKEGGGGPDWPKIAHIADLEIHNSHILAPSTLVANPPVPSTSTANQPVWYRHFLCCRVSLEKEMEKRAATNLIEAESGEIFLEQKRKKKWVDEKTGHFCFMMYARLLFKTWSGGEYWIWNCFKETSENIEVVKLSHVCWMEVNGKLSMSELSPEVVYEIVYVVKLTNGAFGWERPIKLKLTLPDGRVQERQLSLLEKPRRRWIELNVGNFQTNDGESREVGFTISQIAGQWKNGLIVKGAIIRPKQTTL
ncbi:putative disease resistance protein At3g14460 [Corylus avellana]|uniref:putative disease resistance protein At3g14460 n=1 Tax=Corylus avellana TaxID=13451 RepID=UPI00286C3E0D|nr:putative disease resistance protein At3g14460 [Corylus avellana]